MRHLLITIGAIIGLAMASAASAGPVIIADTYIGSDSHGHGDVIGSNSLFDIHGMAVERVGNILTVEIYTNFATAGLGSFKNATNDESNFPNPSYYLTNGGYNNGIGFGDLFLADEYTPDTTGPGYINDNYMTGTDWDYGLSLDNRWSDVGGNSSLFALNSAQNGDVWLSESFIEDGYTFRNGQEVAVNVRANDVTALSNATSWAVDGAANKVTFSVDLTGTSLETASTIGLHWAMSCGNDTIEGAYTSVPEPGTLGLLMLGLIGLVVGGSVRRRRLSSQS